MVLRRRDDQDPQRAMLVRTPIGYDFDARGVVPQLFDVTFHEAKVRESLAQIVADDRPGRGDCGVDGAEWEPGLGQARGMEPEKNGCGEQKTHRDLPVG